MYETKDERTQVEIVRDNGVELVECIGPWYEHQDSLPQEQGETVCSLEVDCDQVGLVGPSEDERVHDVEGSMQSLGGVEIPGPLEATRIPHVNVPVCECVEMCAKCE